MSYTRTLGQPDLSGYAPATGSTSYVGVDRQVLNALDHGIIADGTTDDTTAWNTFLAARSPGDVVLLPPGKTSFISTAITCPSAATGLTFIGWGATLKLSASASSGTTMLNFNSDQGTLAGLAFNANSATNSICVRPRGNQLVQGCRFANAGAAGVYMASTYSDTRVQGNLFTGGGFGVLFDPAYTGSRVNISGNTFIGGATGDAVEVNCPTTGCSDISVIGNTITGYSNTSASGMGVGMARVTGATIASNIITNCGADGIHVEDDSSGIAITGNRVTGCGRAGISLQIGAGASQPRSCSIVGNTIRGCASANGTAGIALEGLTAVNYCTVSANIIRGCGRAGATCYGIDLGSGGTGNMITGNLVSNTIGSSTAGIRWNGATDYTVMGNKCFDDQGSKTQQYPMRVYGVNTNVVIIGNQCNGHLTSNLFDESSISSGSSGFVKRHNRPSGIDNSPISPVFSAAVSDASFGSVVPLNGATAIDQANGRFYFKYGNVWHYVTQTA